MISDWTPDDIATRERIESLLNDLLKSMGLEDFKNLKQEALKFCLKDMEQNQDLGAFYSIKDIGPKIWAFYQGYMACHKEYVDRINDLNEKRSYLL